MAPGGDAQIGTRHQTNMRTWILLSALVALTSAGSYNRHYQKNKRGLYGAGTADSTSTIAEGAVITGVATSLAPAVEPITASGLHLSSESADTSNAIVEVPAPNLAATVTASYQATEGADYGSGGRGAGSAGDYGGSSIGADNGGLNTGHNGATSVPIIAEGEGRQIGEPYLISIHRETVRKFGIPVAKPYPVSVPRNVYIKIERPVPYPVDRPYEVRITIPQPVAVDRPYPVPVDRPYSVPVPRPYLMPIPRPVAVPVPQPIPVPVVRTVVAQPQVITHAASAIAAHGYDLARYGFAIAHPSAAFGAYPAIGAAPVPLGISAAHPDANGVAPAALGVAAAHPAIDVAPNAIGVAASPAAFGLAPAAVGVGVAPTAVGVAAPPAAVGVVPVPAAVGVPGFAVPEGYGAVSPLAVPGAIGVAASPTAVGVAAPPAAIGVAPGPAVVSATGIAVPEGYGAAGPYEVPYHHHH